jgi:hypothetical protein
MLWLDDPEKCRIERKRERERERESEREREQRVVWKRAFSYAVLPSGSDNAECCVCRLARSNIFSLITGNSVSVC